MRRALLAAAAVIAAAACGADDPASNPSSTASSSVGAGAGGASASSAAQGGSSTSNSGATNSSTGAGAAPAMPIDERLQVSSVEVPAGVKSGGSNWRIWGTSSMGVERVFTAPLANCHTLVCFTTGSGTPTAHIAELDENDALVEVRELAQNRVCRGLAAEPDGKHAALLWDDAGDAIHVIRYDAAGTQEWSTELINANNVPDDFNIGDSRMAYGDGRYGAYYHVHGVAGFQDGHEGDTLKWVDATSGAESTAWDWGCSHMMSAMLRYHPADDDFLSACVTDCFPGTSGGNFASNSIGGLYLDRSTKVLDIDAGCNGDVAGELGSGALAPSGWKIVFNAHQNVAALGQSSYAPSTMDQDIGFVSVGSDQSVGNVVWLTDTAGVDERNASAARWQPEGDGAEQYVVGWFDGAHKLARVDANGAFLEGPVDVDATVGWGERDDPFRAHVGGDVVWAWFDAPGSTTLRFARVVSGAQATCASF